MGPHDHTLCTQAGSHAPCPRLALALQGVAQLQVEQRGSEAEGFGKGHKVPLPFGEMLRRMAGGDTSLYLTTQSVEMGPDGHARLYASPVAELAADIPLVPAVMGSLVPQSINLWVGAARDGEGWRGGGVLLCCSCCDNLGGGGNRRAVVVTGASILCRSSQ